MILTERKACSFATSSTTNPAWTGLGMNLGLHGKRPATNHLSHDMALIQNGRKWLWPNLRYYPGVYLQQLRKFTKHVGIADVPA
jgi:hypothetical protein